MNPGEELRDELVRLREHLDRERSHRRLAESELARVDALYQKTILSTSWRLTYPARVAGILARRGVARLCAAGGAAARRARSAAYLVRHRTRKFNDPRQTAVGDRIPYSYGMRVLARLYDLPLLYRGLFRKSLEDLEQARGGIVRTTEQEREERRHLFSTAFHVWWVRRAGRSPWDEIRPWFPITGVEHLHKALSAGLGVVLVNAHFGGGRLVPLVLVRAGYEVLTIEYRHILSDVGAEVDLAGLTVVELRNTFKARAAIQAVRRLREGKIVHLAGDGFDTKAVDSVRLEFFGRRRLLAIGFAEMALETGAAVLPLFAPFDDRGRVHVEILEPLDPGGETLDRGQRIDGMVRQYVRLLEQRWQGDFGNVNRFFLKQFLVLSEPP